MSDLAKMMTERVSGVELISEKLCYKHYAIEEVCAHANAI